MESIAALLDLVHARPSHAQPLGRAQRLFLAALGLLCAVVFAGVWGLAAGGASSGSLANAVKVPMLLVVSGAVALPAVVLFWALLGRSVARTSDLLVGYAVAVFGGTLVLAALAPLVALYQHSSTSAGPRVALASAVVAVVAGVGLFVRALGRLVPHGSSRRSLAVPVTVMLVVQLAALGQLSSVVSPVFGRRTAFGRGIDALQAAPEQTAPGAAGGER